MIAVLSGSRLTARKHPGARPPLWRRVAAVLSTRQPRQRGPTAGDFKALSPHLRRDIGLDTIPDAVEIWSQRGSGV